MDFDFGLNAEEDSIFDFDKVPSKARKNTSSTQKKSKRKFGNGNAFKSRGTGMNMSSSSVASNHSGSQSSKTSIHAKSFVSSALSSSSQSGATKSQVPSMSMEKSSSRSRRRMRQREEKDFLGNDDDELFSEASHSSSFCGSSSASTYSHSATNGRSYKETTKNELSVRRGAGSSAYAVQDAGTYQMVHDECTYLCSTILSNTTIPSKALEAAIDLATLLSSRKTRSLLWQGGSHSSDDNNFMDGDGHDPLSPSFSSEKSKKATPIPKLWSSILEVLALATTTVGSVDNCPSSNSSISTATSGFARAPVGRPPKKNRTKSARRKEKELLRMGGGSMPTKTNGTANNYASGTSKGSKLNPDMKDILACIVYFLSWDCTMSGEHSIAAMRAVKSSAVARRTRLAILERGEVLNGILRLMIPPQPFPGVAGADYSRQVPFPSKISPTIAKLSEPPISPLSAPMRSTRKRSLRSASMKFSSSTEPELQPDADGIPPSTTQVEKPLSSKITGDPTATGRRKRKNRRKLKEESPAEDMFGINEDSSTQQKNILEDSENNKIMPPPSNRNVRRQIHGSDDLSFDDFSVRKSQRGFRADNDGSSIAAGASMGGTSIFANRLVQRVDSLSAQVHIESLATSRSADIKSGSFGHGTDSQESLNFHRDFLTNNGMVIEGGSPWRSIVCLESLSRILMGKELDGKTSCLEGDEADDNGIEDDNDNDDNVIVVTNRLVGKSGMIPLLAYAMSQSMTIATKLVFGDNFLDNKNGNIKYADEECWIYCHHRLKLIASIIDEACFLSESNRRGFCEDDPFSFQDRKKGLIFHVLKFLKKCLNSDLNQLDLRRSEIMSLALRTLTSLTHDNPLAAEQMKSFSDSSTNFNEASDTDDSIQGIRVLANLVFQLEESPLLNPTKSEIMASKGMKKASDHDMHRYDGTIFCLTTLANISDGALIGRILMEIKLVLHSGRTISWVEWLCQWLVKQTETFRQEILSIGNGSIKTTTADSKKGEIHQEEEEKLVAAGNGCVVLACLITESDDGDPESSIFIRNLIKKKMPLNPDGSSSGLSLVVNTLKAYCNYYQMSMGEMSAAVVSPVRKLIDGLEEIAKADED